MKEIASEFFKSRNRVWGKGVKLGDIYKKEILIKAKIKPKTNGLSPTNMTAIHFVL